MDKEKRHLIQEKVDELVKKYELKTEAAKAAGDKISAFAYTTAAAAVLELSMEILILDATDKI